MSGVFAPDALREVEERLVLEEALKDAVPCTSNVPCGTGAMWSIVCFACSSVVDLFCDPCRAALDAHIAQTSYAGGPARLEHTQCGAPLPNPLPWRPL